MLIGEVNLEGDAGNRPIPGVLAGPTLGLLTREVGGAQRHGLVPAHRPGVAGRSRLSSRTGRRFSHTEALVTNPSYFLSGLITSVPSGT
jgi:hypothetical protein